MPNFIQYTILIADGLRFREQSQGDGHKTWSLHFIGYHATHAKEGDVEIASSEGKSIPDAILRPSAP